MEGLFGKYRVLLAPMAGVSDIAFRTLCREAGADMAFTEMVSAKGLSFANEKTRHLLALADGESQVAVQLFGHEPDVMASQAAWIEQEMGEGLAYLDINMGCPARKIVSKGDGSALMKDPALAGSIVRAVKRAVEHPVTVKFRRGWAEGDETAPAFACLMEEAGADGVTVHGGSPSSCTGEVPTGASSLGCARRCPCPSWATATSAAVPMPCAWRQRRAATR